MISTIKRIFKKDKEALNIEQTNSDTLIVDVRTPLEFKMGHLPSSVNIPLSDISDHIQDFRHAGKKVVLLCRSGARSGQAATLLQSNGIEATNGGAWDSYAAELGFPII